MATLGLMGGMSMFAMGGSKVKATQGPPLNAQSSDEESFIKYVLLSRRELQKALSSS